MKRLWILLPALLVRAGSAALPGEAGGLADATPSAAEIVRRVLNSDPWGLGDADVTARAIVRDESGRSRQLAFRARSLRYDAPLPASFPISAEDRDWAEGIKHGRSYVSDGKSHLLDFSVNGQGVGLKDSDNTVVVGVSSPTSWVV